MAHQPYYLLTSQIASACNVCDWLSTLTRPFIESAIHLDAMCFTRTNSMTPCKEAVVLANNKVSWVVEKTSSLMQQWCRSHTPSSTTHFSHVSLRHVHSIGISLQHVISRRGGRMQKLFALAIRSLDPHYQSEHYLGVLSVQKVIPRSRFSFKAQSNPSKTAQGG